MKDPLVLQMRDFLFRYYKESKPLLVGYSGGADSTALLSLLLECSSSFSLDIRVAHFDHGWREESARQAIDLKGEIEAFGLPFYTKRCEGIVWQKASNKEELAREMRYQFFEKVYDEIGAGALLLAHQQEDAAETVLKRLFEGAGILSSGGMQEVSSYKNMLVWRPCLRVSRKKLIEWNCAKGLSFLHDSTNEDLRFLRPRFRYKIFPYLEKWFGKGIQKNLSLLGEEFISLKGYFQNRLEFLLPNVVEGVVGFALLKEKTALLHPLERKELLRFCLQRRGVSIAKENLQQVEALFQLESHDKRVDVSKGHLIIDGGNVIWIESSLYTTEVSTEKASPFSSLLEGFLQGKCAYLGKNKEVSLIPYASLGKKERERLSSFFARNKIPAKIRGFFPCIKKEGGGVSLPLLKFNENDLLIEENKCILMINFKNIQN